MTNYVFNTAATTLGGATVPLAGDSIFITASGSVVAPTQSIDNSSNNATGIRLGVSGLLYLSQIDLNGADLIQIAATGSIIGSGTNALIAMGNQVGGSQLINNGVIQAGQGNAIMSFGQGDQILNTGQVNGVIGVALTGQSNAGQLLDNSGTILGTSAAVTATGSASIINSGFLSSQTLGAVYVSSASPVGISVYNSGKISSAASEGIYANLNNDLATLTVTNSGEIYGKQTAINSTGTSADHITNTGTILGTVSLGAGDDYYNGQGGMLQGALFLGSGLNTADLRNSVITGYVYGGSSSDVYYVDRADVTIIENGSDVDLVFAGSSFALGANVEYLTLLEGGAFDGQGNASANLLTGNSSDNRLFGYDGIDTLNGGLGDDRLFGGTGNDVFLAGDGDDRLFGQLGADSIKGEAGDDTLSGGLNKDTLFGGDGADVFLFTALSHAGTTAATADVISDFAAADDRIDLSGIDAKAGGPGGDNAFSFIGNGAFTATAGELRFAISGTAIVLEMDVTGDGVADAYVRINGTATIGVDSLIL